MADTEHGLRQVAGVFARGFSYTRSIVHPYECRTVGSLWLLTDAPRTRGGYRRDEWIACGDDPVEVHRVATSTSRREYCISAIVPEGVDRFRISEAYKKLGYRFSSTEAVMRHALERIPGRSASAKILRVEDESLASRLNRAARARQILPEHLVANSPLRAYAALVDDEIAGWVRSITVDDATWVSNLYVRRQFRRRGIGGALMTKLLRDDRRFGSRLSVLTASRAGSLLYPTIGYDTVGTLLFFTVQH